MHDDVAGRVPHGDGEGFVSAHHHAFYYRLPAIVDFSHVVSPGP